MLMLGSTCFGHHYAHHQELTTIAFGYHIRRQVLELEVKCRQYGFSKYVSNIPGKREVKELQKTAILGTAHILRKVLM